MGRKKHPNKHIEQAVEFAISHGWRFQGSSGHAWGRLMCPLHTREGCKLSVWSTPGDPEKHAKQIQRQVLKCIHKEVDYVTKH